HEPYLVGFTPAKEIKGNLTNTLMLRHAVHFSLPSVFCCFQAIVALQILEALLRGVLVLLILFGCCASLHCSPASFAELHVCESNSIIQVQLCCKVPFSVIGVLTSNIVGMQRKKSLIGSHSRGARIEQNHEMVVHIPHRITLESEFVG